MEIYDKFELRNFLTSNAIYGVVDRMNIPEMALAETFATNLG
jgi:hypothetical protein